MIPLRTGRIPVAARPARATSGRPSRARCPSSSWKWRKTRAPARTWAAPSEAEDEDKHRLTYTLEGPNKDSFSITSAGQIRTRAALDHEEREFYSLTVKVNDGQKKNNSVAAKSVTVEVTDRTETPSAPKAPKVSGIPRLDRQRANHVGRAREHGAGHHPLQLKICR